MPVSEDRWDPGAPPGVEVSWLPRDGAEHGARLVPEVREVAATLVDGVAHLADPTVGGDEVAADDLDDEPLWEVPTPGAGNPDPGSRRTPLYAWLAGEAGVVKQLRRHLVGNLGIDRQSVAFMGYWRLGKPGS